MHPRSASSTPPRHPALHLRIDSDPANLAAVRHALEAAATTAGFDEQARADIGLCVNEALANVIRHAYSGRTDRPIDIHAESHGDAFTVKIRDWGNGVNPDTLPRKPHDPLTPGGPGPLCLRQLMDGAEYHPQPDGRLLVMTHQTRKKKPTKYKTEQHTS